MLFEKALCFLVFSSSLLATSSQVPECVKERASALRGNQFLNTRNVEPYLCTLELLTLYYDPEQIACGQGGASPSDGVAAFICPANTTIKCAITIGWGSVAGTCDACSAPCSLNGASGSSSCCAESCVVDTDLCSNDTWEPGFTDTCGSEESGGFCSCCPDCAGCKVFAEDASVTLPGAQVDSSVCDCRNGLDTSSDWTPCWNSCVDCFGDGPQPTPLTRPAFPPFEVVNSCFGKSECYLGNFYNMDGNGNITNGTWALCNDSSIESCTKDLNTTAKLDDGLSKFKGLMLCG